MTNEPQTPAQVLEQIALLEKQAGKASPHLWPEDCLAIAATLRAQAAALTQLEVQRDHYRNACIKQAREIEQTLGKALGFPLLKDCPEIGGKPDDTDVVTFEYTAEVLAEMAAEKLQAQAHRAVMEGE